MKCAVGSCKQNDWRKKFSPKQHITFYSFPKDVEQRKLWIKFCKRNNPINPKRERICALHFKKDDFERNLKFEMGFSNRSTAKLKPGAVPTLELLNTTTNDIQTAPTPILTNIHGYQGQETKSLAAVTNKEATAVKILNEPLTFEEENIPITIIKKSTAAATECDIKIENEEVTVPIIEATAIKKEIETFTNEDSIVPSIATSAVKIENETYKCKTENSSKRTDIKPDSRECTGFNYQFSPALQRGTAPITETSAIKLQGEPFTFRNPNTPTMTTLNQQDSRQQQPKTLEFIVFVPYRVQIRDPSI